MDVRGIEHSFGIVGALATFFDTDFFCGTAVGAVSRLLVTMYTAKRPRSKSKADLSKDLKEACSATKTAQRTGHEEPSAKRFVPTPAAVMTVTPKESRR